MRQCEDCKITLDDDVRFCPNCGRSVADAAPAGGGPNHELGALLTSANLHRVKQEWDSALADAFAALEIDPNNADIASLLASVYEQRGELDEAVIWYRIAIELNPRSSADAVRLERVSRALNPAASTERAKALSRQQWLWIAGGAGVLFVILSIVLTVVLGSPGDRSPKVVPRAESGAKVAQLNTPSTPTGPTGPTNQTGDLAGAPPAAVGARTSAEVGIEKGLTESQGVQTAGASIDDVIADPRHGLLVVTFSVPGGPSLSRLKVLDAARAVAVSAFAANGQVKFVTARCVIPAAASSPTQIAFVGDVARVTLDALGEGPSREQIEQAFTNKWWNPQLK